jgi:hypothetical protein
MSSIAHLYLHGFASSPQGDKAKFLREKYQELQDQRFLAVNFNPTREDFRRMTITGMINRLRQYILDHELEEPRLIGSSLGGLVSLRYAADYPTGRLLLLAPLLAYQSLNMSDQALAMWEKQDTLEIDHYAYPGKIPLGYRFHEDGLNYQEMIQPAAEIMILHGRNDERVPIEDSRYYAEKYPEQVQLIEVESDHRLADQQARIWELIREFLLN